MTDSQFVNRLSAVASFEGDRERQVEAIYNQMMMEAFPGISISNPCKCDGLFETMVKNDQGSELKVSVICEYKYDRELKNPVSRAKVICQILFYLRKFEEMGRPLPNVAFVGDVNECFVIHTNFIAKYLDFEGVDWTVPPSSAGDRNPDLLLAVSNDHAVNPFVFDVDSGFRMEHAISKIKDVGANIVRLIRVTDHNVHRVFSVFQRCLRNPGKISANDLVGLFLGCLLDKENHYLHPAKRNTLVCPDGRTQQVNPGEYLAFMQHFASDYSPKEKARLAEVCDRLVEDTTRRNKGEFYTPTQWADQAHRYVSETLGESWKDEYVVWDCACGTKNLTRDYRFKELYCSTLEQAELDISKNYNKEAHSFKYDFLNETDEDLERKAPGLTKAIRENRKILFLINPPYGEAHGDNGLTGKVSKGTTTSTRINSLMKKDKVGGSDLLKQFLYRIAKIKEDYNLTNVSVACFTKPSWLLKQKGKSLRDLWFRNFRYERGMMFQASEFADVSGQWGITFNVWTSGVQTERNYFPHDLCHTTKNGEIEKFGEKTLCNFDGLNTMTTIEFLRRNLPKETVEREIVYCTDQKTMQFAKATVKVPVGAIGCIGGTQNDVQHNQMSQISSNKVNPKCALPLAKSNFLDSCVVLASKTTVQTNWVIDKDQYNMNVDLPESFVNDCLAYAAFHNYMMAYDLDGTRLANEFFFVSHERMAELANGNHLDETYNEARTAKDSYLYSVAKDRTFSPEARALFDRGIDLLEKSMKYRRLFDEEHPEVQILHWDAGWNQLSRLLRIYLKDEYKEFQGLKKRLASRIKEQVYGLGMLTK